MANLHNHMSQFFIIISFKIYMHLCACVCVYVCVCVFPIDSVSLENSE